jgi:nucleotide-binding universal stress UspA family protein
VSTPRRILCPTDFSPCADRALAYALTWSRQTGAEIHVLHVIADSPYDGHEAPPYRGVIEARDALERLIESHGAASEAFQAITRDRAIAESIMEHAVNAGIDLIVMGIHGRRGFRSLHVGSQTDEVVRAAPCPVLAVPERPALSAPSLPRLTLVPLDFGPRAVAALRYAKELAHAGGGYLVLLNVIENVVVPDFDYLLGRSIFLREPEALRLSTAGLQRLFWEAGGPDVPFDTRVVEGRAAMDIPRIASEIAADAIVMPTHGLAAPERLTLGTTTNKILRSAPCPVLVHCEPRKRLSKTSKSDTARRKVAAFG